VKKLIRAAPAALFFYPRAPYNPPMSRLLILLLFTLPPPGLCHSAPFTTYLNIEGFAYTEPLPYQEFVDDWSSGYRGGTVAMQHNWLELGLEYRQWGLAVVRQDYGAMAFSRDTADFYYLTENRQPLPADYRYDIDLEMRYLSMEGVRLFRRINIQPHFQLLAAVNILQGRELLEGRLAGGVTVLSENDYDFDNVRVDYHYSEDLLFERPVKRPSGEGYGIDLAGRWQATPRVMVAADIRNLFGYLNWKNTPYTTANVSSDNKEFDENGYVVVHPALTGRHEFRDFRQQLPRLAWLRFEGTLGEQSQLLGELLNTEESNFVSFGLGYQITPDQHLKTLFTANTHAITLAYQTPWLHTRITLDDPNPAQARHWGLQLLLQLSF